MTASYDSSKVYATSMLLYQLAAITLLNMCGISPLCSLHINLFLKCFIPIIIIGNTVLLLVIEQRGENVTKKSLIATLWLLLHSLVAFFIGAFVYHIISVLLGALLFDVVEETFLFSCLCSSLTIFPLFIVYETRWEEIINSIGEPLNIRHVLSDTVKFVSYFTIVGAWLGALPIPLDWGRDWQTWPITCCVSAMSGNAVGLFISVLHCVGVFDRIRLTKWKNW